MDKFTLPLILDNIFIPSVLLGIAVFGLLFCHRKRKEQRRGPDEADALTSEIPAAENSGWFTDKRRSFLWNFGFYFFSVLTIVVGLYFAERVFLGAILLFISVFAKGFAFMVCVIAGGQPGTCSDVFGRF